MYNENDILIENLALWLKKRGFKEHEVKKAVSYILRLLPGLDEAIANSTELTTHEEEGRKFIRIRMSNPCNKIA